MKNLNLKDNPWIIISFFVLGLLVFSQFFEIEIRSKGNPSKRVLSEQGISAEEEEAVQAFLKFKTIKSEAIPSGVPDVYGKELGVSFDEVQESMDKMRIFGPTYGTDDKKIKLEGEEFERYVKIGEQTSCEYCCGVKTLVKEDGEAACGCAHSIVMRGLTAYLIKNHSDKFSDEEILNEVNAWKKVFFPKQTLAVKFDELKESGDENIETLLQEFPDFLPQMVGGC